MFLLCFVDIPGFHRDCSMRLVTESDSTSFAWRVVWASGVSVPTVDGSLSRYGDVCDGVGGSTADHSVRRSREIDMASELRTPSTHLAIYMAAISASQASMWPRLVLVSNTHRTSGRAESTRTCLMEEIAGSWNTHPFLAVNLLQGRGGSRGFGSYLCLAAMNLILDIEWLIRRDSRRVRDRDVQCWTCRERSCLQQV